MNQKSKKSLLRCLRRAVRLCTCDDGEERGGFIIRKIEEDAFEFHPVTNVLTGTAKAYALYLGHPDEYGDKILAKTNPFDAKWIEHASFHTHPRGCAPIPSLLDLRQLFTGQAINYIYSPHSKKLICYTYDKESDKWKAQPVILS